MVAKHKNLGLNEEQRQRWVSRLVETADAVGLPDDPGFRSTLVAYLEWGTRIQGEGQPVEITSLSSVRAVAMDA